MKKVNSLEEMSDAIFTAFGDHSVAITTLLFDNLVEETPEKTGTLKFNWRFTTNATPGLDFTINDGTNYPDPKSIRDKGFVRNFQSMTIYNNSPYIEKVNNGEGGNQHNQNFIQAALARTASVF